MESKEIQDKYKKLKWELFWLVIDLIQSIITTAIFITEFVNFICYKEQPSNVCLLIIIFSIYVKNNGK